jgi:hypothetical protein
MFDDIDPFTATPRELLAEVVDLEPGAMAMSVLLMIDRRSLSSEDAITFLQVHERLTSWWAAVQSDVLVAAAHSEKLIEEYTVLEPREDREQERTIRIQDAVREEVSSALRWAPATAQSRIDSARLLDGPLAHTREALARGEISTGHVTVLVEAARRLPGYGASGESETHSFAQMCQALQDRVLPVARRGTLSMTRQAANRAVLAIDGEGQRRRREAARCTRGVWVVDELDGISLLMARMATESAHAVMSAIDHAAAAQVPLSQTAMGAATVDANASPDRSHLSIGERRAEAFAALVLEGGTCDRPAVRAHLDVLVPLDVLLDESDGPAELIGSGPCSAALVLDLLADRNVDVSMRRLVADPVTGTLVDVGRRSYEVPDRLRQLIVGRDRTCRFPGCQRKASRCQIDHAEAWEDGGETSAANLGALCVRHHQLKTHGGWDLIHSDVAGGCTWVSPQGRRYRHEADPMSGHSQPASPSWRPSDAHHT